MHEIHLGPSELCSSLPSSSVPLSTRQVQTIFFVIYVQFISLSRSLSYSALALPHALIRG